MSFTPTMPNQPGVHVFALPDRPKQTRRRRKKTTGTSDTTAQKSAGSRKLTRRPPHDSSTSTSASTSTGNSSNSGSLLGVGPVRNTRQKRTPRTNDHYGSWINSVGNNKSPSSTEGTTPKTPESFGSPASTTGPPARRNAIYDGFVSSEAGDYSPSHSPDHSVPGHSSGYEEFGTSHVLPSHGMSHAGGSTPESFVAENSQFVEGHLVQDHVHSLNPMSNVPSSSHELSARTFNTIDTHAIFHSHYTNNSWDNYADNANQFQPPLQPRYSQATEFFDQSYSTTTTLGSSAFGMTSYPELEPLPPMGHEFEVPGAYPLAEGSMNAQICPTIRLESWDLGFPSSQHDADVRFAEPSE